MLAGERDMFSGLPHSLEGIGEHAKEVGLAAAKGR